MPYLRDQNRREIIKIYELRQLTYRDELLFRRGLAVRSFILPFRPASSDLWQQHINNYLLLLNFGILESCVKHLFEI